MAHTSFTRNHDQEFAQGRSDSSYITITPDRGGVLGDVPTHRKSWPSFARAEQDCPPYVPGD